MSPFAIDEDRMSTDVRNVKDGKSPLVSMDPAHPPLKSIPHMDFPRVVYKHPKEPYKKVEHRNAQFEVVGVETVPAEHKTMKVSDKKELDAAMKKGWVLQPFVAPPREDPNAGLYGDDEE